MIALLVLAAVPAALVLSLLTAIVVAVRGYTAATPAVVGPPPAGLGARTVAVPCGTHALAGWFAPGRPGGGAVLLLHGIRSDRRVLASRMAMLARRGAAVLAVDLRAHGESGGASVTLGLREAEDVAACLAWLRHQCPGERVGGLGISLGGAALALASRTAPVDALVLESVFAAIDGAIRNRMALVAGAAAPWLTPLFTAVGMGMTGLHPADLRPIEALRAYPGPVLVIGGGADPLTPPSETRALCDAAPGDRQLWIVEGAGHVDMASFAGSDYEGRVAAFLALHLGQMIPCA
ncbi:alpha/beta hydrolase [Lichenibacterium dinghuense]|uniref:alpha/beta hydrolase n=1 Tax=Lichenibacterium dinghuense TaxID=2895977 RepID=UPI001F395AE9|nr:alpha/beta fold hydrolase [Lichenibacterium sp. 6Y81]